MRRRFARIEGRAFKEARLLASLSRKEAARALFVCERTVRNWEAGRARVPYSAYKLLKVLSGLELPGRAWQGWSVRGDALYSPESREFRPWELAWWGLTVAMARAFQQRYREPATVSIVIDGSEPAGHSTWQDPSPAEPLSAGVSQPKAAEPHAVPHREAAAPSTGAGDMRRAAQGVRKGSGAARGAQRRGLLPGPLS